MRVSSAFLSSLCIALWLCRVCAITAFADPSIQCWGNNSQGQTTPPATLSLTKVPADPTEVKTGRGMTCVLSQEGKVTCWGEPYSHLAKLQSLSDVTSFGVSSGGACAIVSGQVQCFSSIGSKDTAFEAVPTLSHPKSVEVGNFFACASDDNGIECWGGNDKSITSSPQLIHPTKFQVSESDICALDANGLHCWGEDKYALETIPQLTQPTDFFMGLGYTCATDSVGVHCWGNPTLQNLPAVPALPQASGIIQYVAGQAHVCGLDAVGVQCWGNNDFRQLVIPPLSHPQKLYSDPTGNQTCALDDSGLVCWGEDQAGQSSLSPVDSLSSGYGNTCVATATGTPVCWGTGSVSLQTPPPQFSDVYQISTGANFACVVNATESSGSSCYGDNQAIQTSSPALPILPNIQNVRFFAALPIVTTGYAHACTFLRKERGISCFGNNDYGQAKVPLGFISLGNSGTISAGGYHTCGIDAVQGLQCWGRNDFSQSTVPTTLKNPRLVSAGYLHTCALDDNGVSCWGRGNEGQTTVPSLSHPRMIQSGGYHTCALDDHGVVCWGQNTFGQTTIPITLTGRITTLSTGQYQTCVATQ